MALPSYDEIVGEKLPSYDELTSPKTPAYEELVSPTTSEPDMPTSDAGPAPAPRPQEDLNVATAVEDTITSNILSSLGGTADLLKDTFSIPGATAGRPSDQQDYDVLLNRRKQIESDLQSGNLNAAQVEGHARALEQLNYRIGQLANPPRSETFGGQLGQAAQAYRESAQRVPGAAGAIARGVGNVAAAVPLTIGTGGTGLALATAQQVGSAESAARTQTEQQLKAAGVPEKEAEAMAQFAGTEEALKAAVTMPAYLLGGKVASGATAALIGENASPLLRAAVGTVGATAANVGTGSAIRAIEGEPAAPTWETATQDVLWGIVHGAGEFAHASEAQKVRALDEIAKRKVDVVENQTITGETPKPKIYAENIQARLDELEQQHGPREIFNPQTGRAEPARNLLNEEADLLKKLETAEPMPGQEKATIYMQRRNEMVHKEGLDPNDPRVRALEKAAQDSLLENVTIIGPAEGSLILKPTTGEPNAIENTSAGTPDGGLRPRSEIQELPATEGSQGVQQSGQGDGNLEQGLARNAPSETQQIVPAIRVGDEVVKGNPGETHQDILNRFIAEHPEQEVDAIVNFDSKSNPNFFVGPDEQPISREQLKEKFGVSDSQGLRELQQKEESPVAPERNLGPEATNVEELQQRPVREIGAYNADVDARRQARGAEPLFSAAREEAPETWDKAVAKVEQDPELPTRLIKEINEGTRKSVTREDQTAILWKLIDLENRRLGAEEKAANPETGAADQEAYREEFLRLDKELNDAEAANRKAGTFSSTALNIRRLIATENFTYARMLRRAELSKGESLSDTEKAEVKKQSEGILRTEAELAAKDPNSTEGKVDESIRQIEEEAKKNPEFTPQVRSLADRISERLEKAAQAALSRLRGKLAGFGSAPDPTILADVVIYGASKIAKGLVKFGQWSTAMVKDFGEGVKPYLEDAWIGANKHIDDRVNASTSPKQRAAVKEAVTKEKTTATADTITEEMKGKKPDELRSSVHKLMETLVRSGVKGRDALVDAVHERMKTIDPSISRRQTMDLMSGYGNFKKLNPEAVKAEVRDIKQQLQLVAKIQDVQAKIPLKKSGVERQALSDESRRLTQELNENIRKLGVVVSDPETQLKTILAAQETRLTNRIKDLRQEIADGERRVKTKTQAPTNEKIETLKKELAVVQAEHEKVLGKRESTEEQKIKGIKAALNKRNADLEDRMSKGDFEPRKKKPPLDLSKDPEAVKAKAENERLKKQFALKQYQWQQAQRSKAIKAWDFVKDVAGASRSLITSADVSAPFRQGGFLLIGDLVTNPKRAAKQIGSMFHQLVSEKAYEEAQASLALRPNADLYQKSGLYFSDLDSKLSAREESMRSNLAEKIPGVGRIVRASNRAYTGFLNRQRADAFDALVESLGGRDQLSDADTKLLANAVNVLTGRGTAAGFERSANTLAKYFFSPRFLASRIQTLIGHPIAGQLGQGASPAVRRAIAMQYGKFGLGLAAIYGLASLAGAKTDKDPRSSDFGKMRFGNTRIDPLTGLQQVLVLLSRTATGQQKVQGQLKPVSGDTYYRFVRSKLAPVPGTLLDLRLGRNVVGEKVTPGSALQNLTVPMSYQDVNKVYKENGALKGTVLEVLNLLGMGLQNYGK